VNTRDILEFYLLIYYDPLICYDQLICYEKPHQLRIFNIVLFYKNYDQIIS